MGTIENANPCIGCGSEYLGSDTLILEIPIPEEPPLLIGEVWLICLNCQRCGRPALDFGSAIILWNEHNPIGGKKAEDWKPENGGYKIKIKKGEHASVQVRNTKITIADDGSALPIISGRLGAFTFVSSPSEKAAESGMPIDPLPSVPGVTIRYADEPTPGPNTPTLHLHQDHN